MRSIAAWFRRRADRRRAEGRALRDHRLHDPGDLGEEACYKDAGGLPEAALAEEKAPTKNLAGWPSAPPLEKRCEVVLMFKKGQAAHVQQRRARQAPAQPYQLLGYPDASGGGKDRLANLAMHPTVKPLATMAEAMLDRAKRRALVLDAFGGSGSTLMAPERNASLSTAPAPHRQGV